MPITKPESLDDVVIQGKTLRDWTIQDHNHALDTLGAHIYEPFSGVLVLGAAVLGIRLLLSQVVDTQYQADEIVRGMRLVRDAVPAVVHETPPATPAQRTAPRKL